MEKAAQFSPPQILDISKQMQFRTMNSPLGESRLLLCILQIRTLLRTPVWAAVSIVVHVLGEILRISEES